MHSSRNRLGCRPGDLPLFGLFSWNPLAVRTFVRIFPQAKSNDQARERAGSKRGREAMSLAPRLQPGDSKPGIEKPFLTVFVGRKNWEKPLETVQGFRCTP